MNENLDLTKILEGCPKGTAFYSSACGKVIFIGVRNDEYYPIELRFYPDEYKSPLTAYITKDGRMWFDCNGECTIFPSKDQRDWAKFERFWDKPKVDRFDPNTLQPFDKVLCRDDENCYWHVDLFSHRRDDRKFNYECLGSTFKWCIPYNEETKHLVGTTDDCPEYYKWWEE